jgi:hypothetical protein
MKKKLLFMVLMGLLLPVYSFAQTNLLENPNFADPATGKYRADCQADGCFNGNVPGWFTDPGCTDTGLENPMAYTEDGDGRTAFAYDNDGGATCQVVGVIDATKRKFTLKYWSKVSWGEVSTDTFYFVTYFYSFTGTDTVNKVKLDSLAELDEAYAITDTNYFEHTHIFTVPATEVGKNLAIGFDLVGLSVSASHRAWAYFDDFLLTVEDAPAGIKQIEQSLVKVSPNPSNGKFNLKTTAVTKFEIFDITGKLIKSGISRGNDILDLTKNSKGIYLLRANNEVQKLIIE